MSGPITGNKLEEILPGHLKCRDHLACFATQVQNVWVVVNILALLHLRPDKTMDAFRRHEGVPLDLVFDADGVWSFVCVYRIQHGGEQHRVLILCTTIVGPEWQVT